MASHLLTIVNALTDELIWAIHLLQYYSSVLMLVNTKCR